MARPHRRLLVALLIAATTLLAISGPAVAAERSFRPVKMSRGKLVFKLRGLSPQSIGAARLRVGRKTRRVSLRAVRRAARRGVLRVRAPRSVRRRMRVRMRRARSRRDVRAVTSRVKRRTQLVLVVDPTPAPSPSSSPVSCPSVPGSAFVVSPSGSDSAAGTATAPWRTLDKAIAAAGPGATVLVRGGNYGASGKVTYFNRNGTAGAPVTFVGAPGESAVIAGMAAVEANNLRLCNLKFNGPTGPVAPKTAANPGGEEVKIYLSGDDVEIANSEITGDLWHAGIYTDSAQRFRLAGNYVHDNGAFGDPTRANLDQGIYIGSGSGVIEDNRVENNYAYGIQLYPDAANVTIRRNTIRGQGRAGIIVATNASNNTIDSNTITDNRRGVQAWDLQGTGNQVTNNTILRNPDGALIGIDNTPGITATNNTTD